ncbi:MAG TPA: hypothetical protein PK961_09580 [bacterium]|nr:hypothetical protein [bacterium]
MKRLLWVLALSALLAGCAANPIFQAQVVSAKIGDQEMACDSATFSYVIKGDDLELRARATPPAVVLMILPEERTKVVVDWDKCAFTWPDGMSEPVLGATPLLGAGQVGLRAPTPLPPTMPTTFGLSPASRAGRDMFDASKLANVAGQEFTLLLALIVNGQPRTYELTFKISS